MFMALFAGLSACCDPTIQDCTSKIYDAGTCPDDSLIGTWQTDGFVGTPVDDGTGYGSSLSECQSLDYNFALSFNGYYDGNYGTQIWGGVESSGTMEVKDKHTDASFINMDASDFVSFMSQPGWAQLLCDETDVQTWTCDWENDNRGVEFGFEFYLDAADPNTAYLDYSALNYPFLGEDVSETYSCGTATHNQDVITLRRTNTLGSASTTLANGNQLAECVEESTSGGDTGDTGGDTGATTTPQPPPAYRGYTPDEWVLITLDAWLEASGTRMGKHAAADQFLAANVAAEDQPALAPFVHESIDRYYDDPMFRDLVDNTANMLDSAPPSMVEDFAAPVAGLFLNMHEAWLGERLSQPFNPPPPPPVQ